MFLYLTGIVAINLRKMLINARVVLKEITQKVVEIFEN